MVTVDTNQAPPQPGLKKVDAADALPRIDMAKFTQSELQSLSLSSSTAFDLRNTDDLVIPSIDRSVFNESAGSRGQIFSRPRSSAPGSRPRLPKPSPSNDDPYRGENKSIVNFLKQMINENQHECRDQNLNSVTDNSKQIVVYDQGKGKGKRKRKRERERERKSEDTARELDEGVEFEVVNVNGAAVDFVVLEKADDLYGAELRRRTAGAATEEDGLGFFRGLEGEWCSRRMKRRIVDASLIGDWLPVGWKLVLALKRKDGRFSVYCRTYLSPSGVQFPSCKDVSQYLQSHYGFSDSILPIDQGTDGVQHASNIESGNQHAGSIHKPRDVEHNIISNSPMPSSLLSEAHGKELSLLDIDNLPEVQVTDTFECRNCDITFGEKGEYMQHLLSFHRKTTRRFRFGSSVGKGVIIKDGKFECQFCHKVFLERRSYNCHVGIHVRTNVRKPQELRGHGTVQKRIQSPTKNAVPSQTAKLDALLQVAENSFLETSSVENDDKHDGGSSPDQQNSGCNSGHATVGGHTCEAPQHIESLTNSEELRHNEVGRVEGKLFQSLPDISKDLESNATVEEWPNFFISLEPEAVSVDMAEERMHDEVGCMEGILFQSVPDISKDLESNATVEEGPNSFISLEPEAVRVDMAEEPRHDEAGRVEGKLFQSLPDISKDLGSNATVEEGPSSLVSFEPEPVRYLLTSVCVWCRSEFYHETVSLEGLSDTIGFMCPTCKAKISGQLDNGLSMNSHCF